MRGVTLIELLVVIVLLGLVFGLAGLGFASLRAPREAVFVRMTREARAAAIRSGRPVPLGLDARQPRPTVLFLPDGRAIGSGVDPLTGAVLDAAR